MKYSLRSLMIVTMAVPPFLAMAWINRELAALVVAVLLPVLLIAKWRLWGVVGSVLVCWAAIYSAHLSIYGGEDDFFSVLWIGCGPAIMFLWCLLIYGAVRIFVRYPGSATLTPP